jgi:small GTP-binding protein
MIIMVQKKVCMLGAFAVGKTSLVLRFVDSVYSDSYHTTIGVKIDKKVVSVAGSHEVTLVLWDIYGADEFQQVRMSYLHGMAGCLLVVDGTRRATLDEALAFDQKVRDVSGRAPSIIVINKSDLAGEWEVEAERVGVLERRGRIVVRTSAKTGEGVQMAFDTLASAILEVGK